MISASRTFKTASSDVPSSLAVFLVALPLCLGIAHGSGAPLMAGIVAGIIGGLVVGGVSGSSVSVSGPAAGLVTIVAAAIESLPSWGAFALAVLLAGAMQIGLGALKLGKLGEYIPNSVIKGMLASIGLLLILKQVPHLLGYDVDFEGDEGFFQKNQENTFTTILHAFSDFRGAALGVGLLALGLLILWEKPFIKRNRFLRLLPGPLVAVAFGVGLHEVLKRVRPELWLQADHMVQLPVDGASALFIGLPALGELLNPSVWRVAVTLAIVASLESLLSVAAADRIDPHSRVTSKNRELIAQGCGNAVSGLIGCLPITSVIVRTSANITFGAQSKLSTMLHGGWLLLATVFFAHYINAIPLAALAAILSYTGYKLAQPALFREMFRRGWSQFLPFAITIGAVIFTDLLTGILAGLAAGLFFVLRSNFHTTVMMVNEGPHYLVRFRKDVSFLNKPELRATLDQIPSGSTVLLDLSRADFIDRDVLDMIDDFETQARERDIRVETRRRKNSGLFPLEKQMEE